MFAHNRLAESCDVSGAATGWPPNDRQLLKLGSSVIIDSKADEYANHAKIAFKNFAVTTAKEGSRVRLRTLGVIYPDLVSTNLTVPGGLPGNGRCNGREARCHIAERDRARR